MNKTEVDKFNLALSSLSSKFGRYDVSDGISVAWNAKKITSDAYEFVVGYGQLHDMDVDIQMEDEEPNTWLQLFKGGHIETCITLAIFSERFNDLPTVQ